MNFTIVDSVILLSISSVSTMVFVQVFKTILNSILIGKIDLKTLFSDGDFPSSHTAILVSFNIVFWHIIYVYSLSNPNADMFSATLVGLVLILWSCYEIRDAMGVRLRVQEHAHAIKQIVLTSKDMSGKLEKLNLKETNTNSRALEEELDDLLSNLKLKAGHLPHEVLGGIITGGLIGCLCITVADNNFKLLTLTILGLSIYILLTILIFIRKRMKNSQR